MPITYEVKDNGRLVHAKATGAITEAELLAYVDAVTEDDRVFKGAYSELFDASFAVDSRISLDALRQVAGMLLADPDARAARRLAIVVGTHMKIDKVEFYEQLAGGVENIIIFNDVSTARTWLGYAG